MLVDGLISAPPPLPRAPALMTSATSTRRHDGVLALEAEPKGSSPPPYSNTCNIELSWPSGTNAGGGDDDSEQEQQPRWRPLCSRWRLVLLSQIIETSWLVSGISVKIVVGRPSSVATVAALAALAAAGKRRQARERPKELTYSSLLFLARGLCDLAPPPPPTNRLRLAPCG